MNNNNNNNNNTNIFFSLIKNTYIKFLIFKSIHNIHIQLFGNKFRVVYGEFDGFKRYVVKYDQCWCAKWLVKNRYVHLVLDRLKRNKRISFKQNQTIFDLVELLTEKSQLDFITKRLHSLIYGNRMLLLDSLAVCPYKLLVECGPRFEGTSRSIEKAAALGLLDNIKYLIGRGIEINENALTAAAKNGHINVVKYIIESKSIQQKLLVKLEDPLDNACANGHLDVIRYLHESGLKCTKAAMDRSSSNGYLEVVKFLHENRTEGCSEAAINGASEKGHLDVVKFLHYNRSAGCTSRAIELAPRNNSDGSMVTFLLDHGLAGFDETVSLFAALQNHENPNYPNVRILLERHPPSTRRLHHAMRAAIDTNNTEIAELCYQTMVKYDPNWEANVYSSFYFYKTIELPMIKWVINRFPMIVFTSYNFMSSSTAEVVKFLLEQKKLNIDVTFVDRFVTAGNFELMKIGLSKCNNVSSYAFNNAVTRGYLDIVIYLNERFGSQIKSNFLAVDGAAMYGEYDMVVYILENRTEGFKFAYEYAKTFHYHDIIKYFKEKKLLGSPLDHSDKRKKKNNNTIN